VTGRSLLLVALLALLWGSGFPLVKLAVETIPPVTVAALRALVGGLLLLVLLGRPLRAQLWPGLRSGAFAMQAVVICLVPWTLVAWASREIDASLATVLNSLSPIFAFLFTWAITRHEAATARKLYGVLVGLAGVITIIGVNALAGVGRHTIAEIACVLGSMSYGIAAIVGTRYARLPPLVPAAGSTLTAAIVLVPLALLVDQPWTLQPSLRSALGVLGLATISTAIAFFVYFKLLAAIGTIATTSQAYLRIIVGVGLSVAFLGERLTPSLVAGSVLVVAGVVAMTLPARRTA